MSSVIQWAELSLSLVEKYGYWSTVSLMKTLSKSDAFESQEKEVFMIVLYRLDKVGKQSYRRRIQRIISALKKSLWVSEQLHFKAQLSSAIENEIPYTQQVIEHIHDMYQTSDIQTESIKEPSIGLTVKGSWYVYHRSLDEDVDLLLWISSS